MAEHDPDLPIRHAAFERVRHLTELHGQLSARDIAEGFYYEGERLPLVNPQRGIFKPKRMQFLLSIRTVFPRTGARVWYDDQREVHRQIFEGEESVDYAFMGKNADAAENRWLREASEHRVPIIYFLGIADRRYRALVPAFVAHWNRRGLRAGIVFGELDQYGAPLPETAMERRYALRSVKQRLHQNLFREAVLTAYGGRCAVSGLPEQRLLDAAHIVSDGSEKLGQPVVPNGLPLSKTHHAAFDAHLIGIDPDYRLHVAERLLEQRDGPMLQSLQQLHRQPIKLPRRERDYPDRERLAVRFEEFRAAA